MATGFETLLGGDYMSPSGLIFSGGSALGGNDPITAALTDPATAAATLALQGPPPTAAGQQPSIAGGLGAMLRGVQQPGQLPGPVYGGGVGAPSPHISTGAPSSPLSLQAALGSIKGQQALPTLGSLIAGGR